MLQMLQKKTPKTPELFECKFCDFKCSKTSDWERHISTPKHNKVTHVTEFGDDFTPKKIFKCENCNKQYLSRNGLWVHKKKCINNKNINITEEIKETKIKNIPDVSNKDDLIIMLLKQNSELLEIVKNGTNNINNNCNNYSNNKTFNLQLFLNETCKNAMNITDFIDSIKLQLPDLEKVGEVGYIEGISNIITKNLIALDVTQRPIHCTDKKRDILYVKDENKWHKEDENKKQIRHLIKRVSHKNINMIPKFKEAHPDCGTHDSKYSDQYNKIIIEAMGGKGDNNKEKEDKIIKNILKSVIIDKLNI